MSRKLAGPLPDADGSEPGTPFRAAATGADANQLSTNPSHRLSASNAERTSAPAGTIDGKLIAMSGTSVSAGVVSGVAALMLEANGSLRQGHVKMALQLSAQFLPEGVLVAGSGSLNAAGAVWMAVNGPSPKVPNTVIGGDEIAGSGVLFWFGKKNSGLRNIIDGDRIIWGDRITWGD